jgi:N-acetylglucosamine-6-phosphate deacetylase
MGDIHVLANARLPRQNGLFCLEIRSSRLWSLMPMDKVRGTIRQAIDLKGDWLSLGGIDLQINGALGLAFPEVRLEHLPKLHKVAQFLWDQGIDAFMPTLVTTSLDNVQASLATLHQFQGEQQTAENQGQKPAQIGARVLGVHLEGPFLNGQKRGAHPEAWLQALSCDRIQSLLGDHSSLVKIITLAPELDPSGQTINFLREQGIIVSLGHSMATVEQAQTAFAQGATMVTHAFNAMPALHHREPGLLGAALTQPLTPSPIFCGFIADGKHVSPTMLHLFLNACRGRMKPIPEGKVTSSMPHSICEGAFLVSDALAPLGFPDGVYPWDEREITVEQGTAYLSDGTLSGTTLPLLDGAKRLAQWGLCDVGEAIALATEAPRQAIGLPGLALHQNINLLRWHWDEPTQALSWQRVDL